MAIQTENGDFLLEPHQVAELRPASDLLRDKGLLSIDLSRAITFEEFFQLVVVQATLDGEEGFLDELISVLENALARRQRPN